MSTTQHYIVSGMTCSHCVAAVSEEVSAIEGVRHVVVDLGTGGLSVTSDAEPDFAAIAAAVDEAGYSVVAA